MVHRPLLREVDLLARKHVVAQLFELCLARQLHEQLERLLGKEVFGKVKDDFGRVGAVGEGARELGEALRVLGEVFLQHDVLAELAVVLLELFPGIELVCLGEAWHFSRCCCRCYCLSIDFKIKVSKASVADEFSTPLQRCA